MSSFIWNLCKTLRQSKGKKYSKTFYIVSLRLGDLKPVSPQDKTPETSIDLSQQQILKTRGKNISNQ